MQRLALVSVLILWGSVVFASEKKNSYEAGGTFAPFANYRGIKGEARIIRTTAKGTIISVKVSGLKGGLSYPVHVHALPCAVNQAGGHYQLDPSAKTGEANEIWLGFTADKKGHAHSKRTLSHLARPDAQSICVHDPEANGAKMACADLFPKNKFASYEGNFAPFAKAKGADLHISGTAQMVTSSQGTQFKLVVSGLSPSEQYVSHVHLFPCSVTEAGGHYELDPSLKAGEEKNEIWFTIPANQTSFKTDITIPHIARADAQSVVIHQMVDGGMPKLSCADLLRTDSSR